MLDFFEMMPTSSFAAACESFVLESIEEIVRSLVASFEFDAIRKLQLAAHPLVLVAVDGVASVLSKYVDPAQLTGAMKEVTKCMSSDQEPEHFLLAGRFLHLLRKARVALQAQGTEDIDVPALCGVSGEKLSVSDVRLLADFFFSAHRLLVVMSTLFAYLDGSDATHAHNNTCKRAPLSRQSKSLMMWLPPCKH